jgi:hypothetical protein
MQILEANDADNGRPAVMLEIVGNVLALFLTWHGSNSPTDMFYIIDWKNGCITMVRLFVFLLVPRYSFVWPGATLGGCLLRVLRFPLGRRHRGPTPEAIRDRII